MWTALGLSEELLELVFRVLPRLTVLPVTGTDIVRDSTGNPGCMEIMGGMKTPPSQSLAAITTRALTPSPSERQLPILQAPAGEGAVPYLDYYKIYFLSQSA